MTWRPDATRHGCSSSGPTASSARWTSRGGSRRSTPPATAISGYPAEELIGRFAIDLIAPEQRELAAQRFAERLAGEASDRDRIGPAAARRHAHPDLDRLDAHRGGRQGDRRARDRQRRLRAKPNERGAARERAAVPRLVRVGVDRHGARRAGRPLPRDQPRVLRARRLRRRDHDRGHVPADHAPRRPGARPRLPASARSPASSARTRWRSATSAPTAAKCGCC